MTRPSANWGQNADASQQALLHGDIRLDFILFEVHKELGFGFREHIYTRALERLLIAKGHKSSGKSR